MGEIPVSDTTKHAAEVLRSIDKRHPLQHSVRIDHGDADRIDALAAAGLLCTPQERELLDDVAATPPPDIEEMVAQMTETIRLRDAIIDAAVAETMAEDAYEAVKGRNLLDLDEQRSYVAARQKHTAAREARRHAVAEVKR